MSDSDARLASKVDPNTSSNYQEVVTEHFHVVWKADFTSNTLQGHVDLSLRSVVDTLATVVLDTRDLTIESAHLLQDGSPASSCAFSLGSASEAFGAALTITLPAPVVKDAQFHVRITYKTSPQASGIQWLAPEQTDGKTHPYVFSQFQAIHCRSAIPVQDTPAVKATYTASVTVPSALRVLMSANNNDDDNNRAVADAAAKEGAEATATYSFAQTNPMPSYLVALVIGKISAKTIGPRSSVWSEEVNLEKGAYEFAETEDYLVAAEALLTPYIWGRYDLLLLPGSFPYGGMENPCLTFVTPTLLAGDRSLSGVVAHEIAHSWTGNSVGCHTWEHFWLNEGFTVCVERKILGRVFSEQSRHFHALIGQKALRGSVEHFGSDHAYTSLVIDLKGVDPDDAFSSVPYERGFSLLFYLESLVGTEAFDLWLRSWVQTYAKSTATTADFKANFLGTFGENEKVKAVDWEAWCFGTGMPPVDVAAMFDRTLAEESLSLANGWIDSDDVPEGAASAAPAVAKWSSDQTVLFLDTLRDAEVSRADLAKLKRIDGLYSFSTSRNSEIRFRWLDISIRVEDENVFDSTVQFLEEQGRMKFVRPLFRRLFQSEKGRQLALDTFARIGNNYHNIAKKMIAADLGV
eukprot:TRINITY_DN415_c1_g4_i2.p1 TRINITY_DN415_c1_g4~~TRINITY_DN415_c1_g4_i2.p1  ORF type:complete len:653 (+),score=175.32 TRINITY_DN415_c1_g4_i2:58-1959(+)